MNGGLALSSEGIQTLIDTRSQGRPPDLSLIVPCYNVEDTVGECLASILAVGEILDLELILIDDGSSDATRDRLLEGLGAVPPRGVLLLQQGNRGLSRVRNLGAALARGRWLSFLDSDDRLHPAGVEALSRAMKRDESDVLMGRAEIFDRSPRAPWPFYHAALWSRLLSGAQGRVIEPHKVPCLLGLEPNMNYRWIRRTFYQSVAIHFPEGRVFEDLPMHVRMLGQAGRVHLLDAPYYQYRVHRLGKITEEWSERRFDVLLSLEEGFIELSALEHEPEVLGDALRLMLRMAWGCGCRTPLTRRVEFFERAAILFARQSPRYLTAFQREGQGFYRLYGGLLLRGRGRVLAILSLIHSLVRRGS